MRTRPRTLSFARLTAVATAGTLGFLPLAGCVKVENPDARKPLITKTSGFPANKSPRAGGDRLIDGDRPAAAKGLDADTPPIELPDTPTAPNVLDTLAPSDARLQEIGGLLLLYYGTRKSLPAKLEDLAPLVGPDEKFDLTCPESGQPYVYVRRTLNASIGGQKLVAYSPTSGKDGLRNALMMSLAVTAQGVTPTSGVTRLNETQLREALQGAAPAGGAGAAAR
jgi:hypothetical protein